MLGEENLGLALALREAVGPTSVQHTSPPVAGNQIIQYNIKFMYTQTSMCVCVCVCVFVCVFVCVCVCVCMYI